jgi:flagellar hook-associated protein 2
VATYDPVTTAKALAESYVHARQAQVDTNTKKTQSKTTALTSLQSALSGFSTALSSLSGKGSVIAQTAAVSQQRRSGDGVSAAAPGNYTFGVSKLATAQQTLYSMQDLGLAPDTDYPKDATMVVSAVGGAGYVQVDLDKADENGDGKLSVTEIARALNQASAGKITASMVTQGGEQKLMLTSTETGEANAFELKMQKKDGSAVALVAGQKLSEAQDAVFTLGAGTGVEIRQASNTYTGIDGLTLEFKEVTTSPFTVTVAKDEAATKANMQGFIDAYNSLVKAIDKLTAAGSAEGSVAAGALMGTPACAVCATSSTACCAAL